MNRILQLLLLSVVLTGCISEPLEPEEHSPQLMIAQNSDGLTTLIWESDSSYLYTVFYRDGSNPWQELRSVKLARGTGESMTASDRVNPNRATPRRYRLHFEKPSGTLR
jgi:hypothetical protein